MFYLTVKWRKGCAKPRAKTFSESWWREGKTKLTQTPRSSFLSYLQELESVSGWLFSSEPDGATATAAAAAAASTSSPT